MIVIRRVLKIALSAIRELPHDVKDRLRVVFVTTDPVMPSPAPVAIDEGGRMHLPVGSGNVPAWGGLEGQTQTR